MTLEAKQLRDKLTMLRGELSGAEKNLASIVASCNHQFGPTVYAPIITPAYHISGDPPGTMGSDWQGPMDVPEHTQKRWSRTCEYCGETQYNTRTKQEIKELPEWPEQWRY